MLTTTEQEPTVTSADGAATRLHWDEVSPSQVRAQLLALPGKLKQASRTYLQRLQPHTDLETEHALQRAQGFLAGMVAGAIDGKNAETRDAQLLLLLQRDDECRQADESLKLAKLTLTASELELRNLRQEVEIRIAALNSMREIGVL